MAKTKSKGTYFVQKEKKSKQDAVGHMGTVEMKHIGPAICFYEIMIWGREIYEQAFRCLVFRINWLRGKKDQKWQT